MLSRIDFCFLFLIKNHCRLETFIGPQTGANKKTAGALQIFQSNELFFFGSYRGDLAAEWNKADIENV